MGSWRRGVCCLLLNLRWCVPAEHCSTASNVSKGLGMCVFVDRARQSVGSQYPVVVMHSHCKRPALSGPRCRWCPVPRYARSVFTQALPYAQLSLFGFFDLSHSCCALLQAPWQPVLVRMHCAVQGIWLMLGLCQVGLWKGPLSGCWLPAVFVLCVVWCSRHVGVG